MNTALFSKQIYKYILSRSCNNFIISTFSHVLNHDAMKIPEITGMKHGMH